MLSDVVRFECRYHAGRAAFAAAALLFLLLGFALTASGFGPDNLPVNAPYLVTESLGFLSLIGSFVAPAFVANAALRDGEHRMAEIVLCTPVGRFDLLAGRFAGAFLATLGASSFAAAGMAAASFAPWLPSERAGALDPRAYAWAWLTMTAPNALFLTALLFAVAALSRSAIATYAAAICVYALYFVAAALTDSPLMAASSSGAGGGAAAALLDPFGLSSFFAEARYWSAAEKATRLAGLSVPFLLNRALWVAASLGIWALTYRLFSFRLLRRERAEARRPPADEPARPIAYAPRPPGGEGPGAWFATFASAARLELGALLRGKAFWLLLCVWVCLAVSELYGDLLDGEYGASSHPATGLVVATLRKPLSLFGTALLIYYGAEAFWREHRFRLAPIVAATPARASAIVVAKCAALAALAACLVAGGVAAGLGVQLSRGYVRFEPALYLSLFYFGGLPLALFATASALAHAVSPNRHVGTVLALLLALVSQRGQLLGLEHHLFRFGTAPLAAYSALDGFGHRATPFAWYMLLWAAVAALMALLAARLWRSLGGGAGELGRALRRRPSAAGGAAAGALCLIATAVGALIYGNTRVLREGDASNERLARKAAYERAYRPTAALPQPSVDDVDVAVDLFPGERRYRVAGRLGLVNRTASGVGTVYVALPRAAAAAELAMPGARPAPRDAAFAVARFEFDAPLAPGGRAELRFDFSFEDRGFADAEPDNSVVANGSLVWGFRCLPTIGYRESYEIEDPAERRRRGLPDGRSTRPAAEAGHGEGEGAPDWVTFAVTLSTSADQLAVAPGALERTWLAGGRRYARYRSDAPARNVLVFASARYEIARRRHQGVDVEAYYHPGHGENVPRMLDAATASLDVFAAAFGPYPHGQLKLVEVPGYWGFGGFAAPDTILLAESRGFLTDARDPRRVDLVARRVAHEVAHQWWGHRLAPPSGPGATALVESLTKYSELLALERLRGREQVVALLELELDRYLAGRGREGRAEPPLAEVGHQAYVYYSKGALVLHAARASIGEAALNGALRGLLRDEGGPDGRPTSAALIGRLLDAAPERERPLLEDWTRAIVIYDLRLDAASSERLPDGRYALTLRASAARGGFDGTGAERPLALNEVIEIGVYGEATGAAEGPTLYLGKHELVRGANEIAIVVDGRPARAALDPNVTRIDRNRFDNARAVDGRR